MENLYCIGTHEFESEEEYRQALLDYEHILKFRMELNLRDSQVAKELYQKLEQSSTLMKSPLGNAFKDALVKLFVAQEVKGKKERFAMEELITVRDRILRGTKERCIKWYWNGFIGSTLFFLLYLLSSLLCVSRISWWPPSLESLIYRIWKKLTIYGGCLYVMMILYSVGLLSISFVRMLMKKVEPRHKLNLLLTSGCILCVYLYATTLLRRVLLGL